MAKHYEALQRAEEARRRRVVGETGPVAVVDWDARQEPAPP